MLPQTYSLKATTPLGGISLSNTKDNDKKKRDNQAVQELKNHMEEQNIKHGSRQYSKKTDHL